MKSILVTGGSGFMGSSFVRYILDKYDCKVANLDILTYAGNKENLRSVERNRNYKFYKGDICDTKLVSRIVEKDKTDTIVHFAAESHVDRSIDNSSVFIRTNVQGTHSLLEVARKHRLRFHHISTDEVFGALGSKGKFNEKTPYDPRSPYSASKAASDHLVRAYFHTHNVAATISNSSNNYGHYQYPEKLIPLAVTNLIEGKKIPIYGRGLNVRDWLYVEDHSMAIDTILNKGKIGETYCLGGNSERRNIDIARAILKEFGLGDDQINYVADRPGHDFRYSIDFSKIRKELGWKPEKIFEQGLRRTVRWYRENRQWWGKLKHDNFTRK
jgi:dTDP-glucose 4,6-dehydratase